MKRMREILRNEYIGAIAIGFLLFQVFGTLINTIMQPIVTYVENRGRPQSVFAPAPSIFNWKQIILSVVSMLLNLLVAWLLFHWLYRSKKAQPVVETPAAGGTGAPLAESAASTDQPRETS